MKKTKFKQTEIGMIPEDWEVGPLSKLAKVIDPHPSHRAPKIVENGFPFAGIGDINEDGSIEIDKCRKIGKEFVKQQERSYKITENSIGYGRVGTVGKVVKLRKQSYRYSLSPTLAIIQPIISLDAKFVYCAVRDMSFFSRVNQQMTGTTRPAIGIQLLREILIPLPPKDEREKIAKIISDLDAKIELNNRMNKILESIGQAIFKRWFVDFEFPNEEGKPYRSSGGEMVYNEELGKEISKGWKVGTLNELVNMAIGGDWGKDDSFATAIKVVCLRGVDLENLRNNGYTDAPIRNISRNSLEKRHITDKDILIAASGIGPIGKSVWIAPSLQGTFEHPVIYSNFCKRLTACNQATAVYVDRILFNMHSNKEHLEYMTGTSIPNLDLNSLISSRLIIIPSHSILQSYYKFYLPIAIKLYSQQSRTLAAIRDALLPKLLSGKIRVPVEVK